MELTRPFAENGDRRDFPINKQSNGTLSLEQGFGPLFGVPPEEGGYFIDRLDFNQIMYLTTKGVLNSTKNYIGNLTLIVGDGPNEIRTLDEALIKSKENNSIGLFSVIILKKDVIWSIEIQNIHAIIKSENENDKKTITFKKQENFSDKNAFFTFYSSYLSIEDVKIRIDESSNSKVSYVFAGTKGYIQMLRCDININQSQLKVAFCAGGSLVFFKINVIGLTYFCWVGGGSSFFEITQSTFNTPCRFNIREGGIAVTGNIANLTGNIAKNTLTPQGIWYFDTSI